MNTVKKTTLLVILLTISLAIAGQVAAGNIISNSIRNSIFFKNGNDYTDTVDVLFDVVQGGALSLGTTTGSVKINTWAKNQIRLVITKRANVSEPYNARTILEDFLVRARHKDGNLDLRGKANSETCKRSVDVTYTVWVPKNYNVDIKTGKGNVDIGELNGSFSAKTADGTISFECEPNGMDIEVEDLTREGEEAVPNGVDGVDVKEDLTDEVPVKSASTDVN